VIVSLHEDTVPTVSGEDGLAVLQVVSQLAASTNGVACARQWTDVEVQV